MFLGLLLRGKSLLVFRAPLLALLSRIFFSHLSKKSVRMEANLKNKSFCFKYDILEERHLSSSLWIMHSLSTPSTGNRELGSILL